MLAFQIRTSNNEGSYTRLLSKKRSLATLEMTNLDTLPLK